MDMRHEKRRGGDGIKTSCHAVTRSLEDGITERERGPWRGFDTREGDDEMGLRDPAVNEEEFG